MERPRQNREAGRETKYALKQLVRLLARTQAARTATRTGVLVHRIRRAEQRATTSEHYDNFSKRTTGYFDASLNDNLTIRGADPQQQGQRMRPPHFRKLSKRAKRSAPPSGPEAAGRNRSASTSRRSGHSGGQDLSGLVLSRIAYESSVSKARPIALLPAL